jgi:uncharacterized membrane protein
MNLYAIVAGLHVVAAVGGLGQISAIGVMARRPEWANVPLLRYLFRSVGWTLIVMLVTGVILLAMGQSALARQGWFSVSSLLFLALGAFQGIGQAAVKKMPEGSPLSSAPQIGKLRTMSLLMSITLALIVFLMEAKPF